MAVFNGYDGGEFCQGLIFGSTGASMLTNIAKTLVTLTQMQNEKGGITERAASQASASANARSSYSGYSNDKGNVKSRIPSSRP